MDLREPTLVATKVGTGIPVDRKALGLLWVPQGKKGQSRLMHMNSRCKSIRGVGRDSLRRVPAYEEEGKAYYEIENRKLRGEVCTNCPDFGDESWKNRGLCVDTGHDFLSDKPTERAKLIEKYCNQCPVVLECLEYGASDNDNCGAIWGGLYFTVNFLNSTRTRDEAVNKRKGEIKTLQLRREVGS